MDDPSRSTDPPAPAASEHCDSAAPGVPPTVRGAQAGAPRPSVWPVVVGVIAIVFGAGGTLFGAWAVVAPFSMEWLYDWMPPDQAEPQRQAMHDTLYLTVPSAVINFGLAILLLTVGIQLVRRRPNARRLGLLWAWSRMAAVVLAMIATYVFQQAHLEYMSQQQSGAAPAAMMAQVHGIVLVVQTVFGLVWGWALPVFMLIWLNRGRIKSEMAAWT